MIGAILLAILWGVLFADYRIGLVIFLTLLWIGARTEQKKG